jgi:hypothetical protein
MDGAHVSKRMYPSYTTAQLEQMVERTKANEPGSDACMKVIAMQDEIERRKSGLSVAFHTPQILGGRPVTKVGRL